MIHNLITYGTGKGLKPMIKVISPNNVTVSISGFTPTIEYGDTHNIYWFTVPLGTYSVVATNGTRTKTEQIVVSQTKVYEVEISLIKTYTVIVSGGTDQATSNAEYGSYVTDTESHGNTKYFGTKSFEAKENDVLWFWGKAGKDTGYLERVTSIRCSLNGSAVGRTTTDIYNYQDFYFLQLKDSEIGENTTTITIQLVSGTAYSGSIQYINIITS